MKSAVESLGPTRAKLTVEVGFDELGPALDEAYKKVGQQVRIKGFRPGKVPQQMIDQYVGRGTVLEEAVNTALPQFYGEAVRTNELDILGHPEIEVTELNDRDRLVFTAEVDVRPEITLPEYDGIAVTVDAAGVTDEQVAEQLDGLRERFATLKGVERAAAEGDYVSIDLRASVDGAEIEDAAANNLSYEVGGESLVPGLDAAIVGLAAGESKVFETQLRTGDRGGESAQATVTVRSVKAKELPALDDDFAQMASEFDTIDELRADVSTRLSRIRTLEQGVQARDHVLEALLALVDVPMPEHVLADEVAYRRQQISQQLDQAGITREAYAEMQDTTVEEMDAELAKGAEQAIRAQFVLEALARKEELQVTETELTDQIVRRAQQSGMAPDVYAQALVQQGALGQLMSELMRGKALALVLERAVITDTDGNRVDLDELTKPLGDTVVDGDDDDSDDDADDDLDGASAESGESGETPAL